MVPAQRRERSPHPDGQVAALRSAGAVSAVPGGSKVPGSDGAARRAPDGPAGRSPLAGGQVGGWAGRGCGRTDGRTERPLGLCSARRPQPGCSPAHSGGSFKPSLPGGFCFDSPLPSVSKRQAQGGEWRRVREGRPLVGSGQGSALARGAVGRGKGKRTPPGPGQGAGPALPAGFRPPCRFRLFPAAVSVTPCQLPCGGL